MAEAPRPILALLDEALTLLRAAPAGQTQQEALALLEALRATLVAED